MNQMEIQKSLLYAIAEKIRYEKIGSDLKCLKV